MRKINFYGMGKYKNTFPAAENRITGYREAIFLHGGDIYEARRKYQKEVIDFSANINPLGLPGRIRKLLRDSIDTVLHYPDPHAKDLTKAIAKYWGVGEENILAGNGSIELIYLLAVAFKPKTALITAPDFSEYERAMAVVKSRMRFLNLKEEDGFRFDISQVAASDFFIISNPHNPSGNIVVSGYDEIERMPAKTIVIDEAFMDFVAGEKNCTMIPRAVKSRKVFVLRTMTKFFALPGLRCGYIVGHKDVIQMLRRYQAPWSINALAQIASGDLLEDKEYIKKTRWYVDAERKRLINELAQIAGLRTFPSAANFVLVKIEKKGVNSQFLSERLLEKGIMIRDCSNFRNLSNAFIRIAVRKKDENTFLIETLKEIFRQ
jgi:threonine-phosphate decarboxylase